jgi:phospholipase/carboxylesterase
MLDRTLTLPASPLVHRVRAGQGNADVAPALVLLHGVGSNEADLIGLAEWLDPRLTVVLARGPLTFGPGQYGWFPVQFGPNGPVIDAELAERSRRLLTDFLAALPAAYGVDADKIVIAGFSQGGIMSAGVALTESDLVAGFGLLSGRILPEIEPLLAAPEQLAGLRAFVSHGVYDNVLPVALGRRSQRLLGEWGVPLEYHEYPAGHEISREMFDDFSRWLVMALGL